MADHSELIKGLRVAGLGLDLPPEVATQAADALALADAKEDVVKRNHEAKNVLMQAQIDALGSQLLEIQQECVAYAKQIQAVREYVSVDRSYSFPGVFREAILAILDGE